MGVQELLNAITTEKPMKARKPQTHGYTVESVDRWLHNWAVLCSLAEGVSNAQAERLHQRIKGVAGDGRNYAQIRADLTSAWNTLEGLELQTVWATTRGFSKADYAKQIQRRRREVDAAYSRALTTIVEYLSGSHVSMTVDH